MRKEVIEFLKECLHNQEVNDNNGYDNRINLDYVIERLQGIVLNDDLNKGE